ncbi:MAG TPA: glycosyltransferase family 2 protein [Candidatus Krumholzibacteria bacterium]|nr:glycosyltransferase family 2 protein [Candidatus Krumholzibacteria bacterium]
MELSIIIPARDEVESVSRLAGEIDTAFADASFAWECIWVDDGSRDGTLESLKALHSAAPERHQYVSLAQSCGQSAALSVGIEHARGRIVGTLDADLQNDPAELPRLMHMLEPGKADMVTGVRAGRRDDFVRRASSRIANSFRNAITGDRIQDVGCSLRVFYRRCVIDVPVFNGMHRFLPTLVRMNGYRVVEVPVGHRARRYGRTKYGVNNRLWRGIADCLAVRWMKARAVQPVITSTSLVRPHEERKHHA